MHEDEIREHLIGQELKGLKDTSTRIEIAMSNGARLVITSGGDSTYGSHLIAEVIPPVDPYNGWIV